MGAANKGMLSREAARKSLMGTLIDLYKSDLAFRGMTDFAVIGFVTMMFLHPPSAIRLPSWGWVSPAPDVPKSVDISLPIEFPVVIKNAKLQDTPIFDFDTSAFRSSSAEDQKRLAAARLSIILSDSDRAIADLRDASPSDPNVALLRGAAEMLRSTDAGRVSAERFLRQAVDGGSVQAKAILGQLLGSNPSRAAANAAEAVKLIEAGVDAGDRQALRIAGTAYMSGELGMLDPTRAADVLKRGADAGDAMAMALYARMLTDGLGVAQKNLATAATYLEKAANAGLTVAQYTLAQWQLEQFMKGMRKDPKEALAWLERAYEKGRALMALTGLAGFYEGAPTGWKNIPLAADYVRRCSGFWFCQTLVGYVWKEGYFGRVDLVAARAHTAVATKINNNAVAQLNEIDAKLSPEQRLQAASLEQKIRAGLQLAPNEIYIQFPDQPPMPHLEAIWPGIPAISGAGPDAGGPAKPSGTPSDLQSSFERGEDQFYKGDYRGAIATFDKYLEMAQSADDQSKALGYYMRGRASLQLALAEGDTCKTLIPTPPSCSPATKFELASKDLEQSLALEPNQADGNFLVALIADKIGDKRKAIDYYTYALRANRDYGAAYNNRGVVYADLGQNDLAMADYNEALRCDQNNAWAWANRGVLFSLYRNKKQAISDLRRALAIDQNLQYARDNLRRLGVRP